MRRLATAAVLPCSVALFIVLAPIAAADETTPSTTTAPTTTTEPGDTTTAPPTTTVPVPRGPKLIQPGVTIVYYDDEDLVNAKAIKKALGVGEVVKSLTGLDVVDVTVVVGRDFATAHPGG